MKHFLLIVAGALGIAAAGLPLAWLHAADEKPNPLADALTQVKCNERTWSDCYVSLALAAELGISERDLTRNWPAGRVEELPTAVRDALRQGADGIEAWVACLEDHRRTGVIENDQFDVSEPDQLRKLPVGAIALRVTNALVPAGQLKNLPGEPQLRRDAAKKAMLDWQREVHGRTADERLRLWFERGELPQRTMLLLSAIEARYAPAYPLLEEDFLRRAARINGELTDADRELMALLSAYFRHRLGHAEQFRDRVEQHFARAMIRTEERYVLQTWRMLTKHPSFEATIEAWSAGKSSADELSGLLVHSIHQPSSNRSLQVEPTSFHVPVMAANLRSLIAAAQREPRTEQRLTLLELADVAAAILQKLIANSESAKKRPLGAVDAPEWGSSVAQLRELMADSRVAPSMAGRFGVTGLAIPADAAARVVWRLWGEDLYQPKAPGAGRDDWRLLMISSPTGNRKALIVAAAQHVLAQPSPTPCETFPQELAKATANRLQAGDAAAWRKQIDELTWEQKLMLCVDAGIDDEFSMRLRPRLLALVDWQAPDEQTKPASFDALWQAKLAGKQLDEAAWGELREWSAAEATAERYWWIVAESSIERPGLSLYVFPTPASMKYSGPATLLATRIDGTPPLGSYTENFYVYNGKLKRIETSEESTGISTTPRNTQSPLEEFLTASQRRDGGPRSLIKAFSVHLVTMPGRQ